MPIPNLDTIIETLAAKVHEGWMDERRSAGWTYGNPRDEDRKQTPFMAAYEALPESEKEVDRATVRNVLQALLDLGYTLAPPGHGTLALPEAEIVQGVRRTLAAPGPLPLLVLTELWNACRNLPDCPGDVFLTLGERILKQGEPILAYDVLSRACKLLTELNARDGQQEAVLLRGQQQLALALAQSGASERARQRLIPLCQDDRGTPESLGLLGRVYKDLAAKAETVEARQELMQSARRAYRAGLNKGEAAYQQSGQARDADGAYYCGINAAAMSVFSGDLQEAQVLARRVKQICAAEIAKGAGHYWLLATLGEAELILGNGAASRELYAAALRAAGPGNWREFASTRKQARRLMAALCRPTATPGSAREGATINCAGWDIETVFPKSSVVVFASPAGPRPEIEPPEAWSTRVRSRLAEELRACGAIGGYLAGVSPADLLFGEALVEQGLEAHLVLPFTREAVRASLSRVWQERFDRLVTGAASILDDAQPSCLDQSVNTMFASLRAHGSGTLRAQRLDSALHLWSLEWVPGIAEREPSPLLELWSGLGARWQEFEPVDSPRVSPGQGPSRSAKDWATRRPSHQLCSMLFADVKGYSSLDDAALLRFGQAFMRRASAVLDEFSAGILSRRTAGDGLFLVFSDVAAAARTGFALRNMVARTNWEKEGLPPKLGIRIGLDAGPVYVFDDAVTGRTEVCGRFVNRAARIEPITPPNEVYASEAYAALYVATGAREFRFDYVGQTQLPKGFGFAPLYCLSENS